MSIVRPPDHVRLLNYFVLFGALVLYLAVVLFVVFIVFPTGMLKPFSKATEGLVNETLLVNLVEMALMVFVLCNVGGLRRLDLGLRRTDLPIAATLTFVTWLMLNLGVTLWQRWSQGGIVINPDWHHLGGTKVFGNLIAQLFGNALFEEILFRGVLFNQLYWRFKGRIKSTMAALSLATVCSQGLFAAAHFFIFFSQTNSIPAALAPLPSVFVAGCAFVVLYLATNNLALVVGIHALANTPTLIPLDPFGYNNLGFLLGMCAAVILVWQLLYRIRGYRLCQRQNMS